MLSISHNNIRSLPKHFDELSHSPYLTKHDIIGISETWLNNSHFSSAYSLPGYSLVRRDRELTCRGGGWRFMFGITLSMRESIWLHVGQQKSWQLM